MTNETQATTVQAEDEESTAVPMLDYQIMVSGVWGRNRKVKRELFKLERVLATMPIPLDKLQEMARAKMREIKLRPSGAQFSIREYPIEVEHAHMSDGRRYEVVKHKLCSDRVLDRGVWEG
jgi:hypothetical protein